MARSEVGRAWIRGGGVLWFERGVHGNDDTERCELKNVKLYYGDCFDVMPKLKNKSVDMIMCDLPYGTTACKWDVVIDLPSLWEQYERVCKGAVVLTAAQPFTSALVMSNVKGFKHEWIWDKVRPVGHLTAKKCRMARHENIVVFGNTAQFYTPQMELRDKPVKGKEGKRTEIMGGESHGFESVYTHKYPQSIIVFNKGVAGEGKVHPTQKPIALMEYLIRTYTNEGMTVLDNCMGSGTTGVACVRTRRKFIGIENDEKYFEIAERRISAEHVQ